MKTLKLFLRTILPLICFAMLVNSCEKESGGKNMTIGGKTDFAENQVGATASGITTIDGNSAGDAQIKAVANSNGITTFEVTASLSNDLKEKITNLGNAFYGGDFDNKKSKFLDSNGNLNTKIKLINSTEGVAFINPNGKQVVVMKYDAKVGDKWSHTKIDGNKVDFEVKHKSTTDDYSYAFFNIKVVKVEQKCQQPGYSKIVYIGNHKFGLVGLEVQLEDGTVLKSTKI